MNPVKFAKYALLVKRGDREAFSSLYRITFPMIWHIIFKKTRNKTRADDIVQEAYIRAWNNREKIDQPEAFIGWIKRIANNVFFDEQRRVMITDPESIIPVSIPDSHDSADLLIEAQEYNEALASDLKLAFANIPVYWKEMLTHLYVDELGYKETAARLGILVGTVRSRAHRSKKMLRKYLAKYETATV